MKKINCRFIPDGDAELIEVTVRAREYDAEIKALMDRIRDGGSEAITVTDSDGAQRVIRTGELVSVSVRGKHLLFVTENERYLSRQSLQSFEDALDGRFVRISRYEIVNVEKVVKFDFTLSGTLRLELTGGMETWASRRCIPMIRKRLKGE
ncbi:MAG: LytTR family transcriptional regulator DNA-binding domain-containing protein [Clostridia bacterium]|nr:LytTR family transcriptional regulator DNA-binding domain-containing protein [Clostridia bacterium]